MPGLCSVFFGATPDDSLGTILTCMRRALRAVSCSERNPAVAYVREEHLRATLHAPCQRFLIHGCLTLHAYSIPSININGDNPQSHQPQITDHEPARQTESQAAPRAQIHLSPPARPAEALNPPLTLCSCSHLRQACYFWQQTLPPETGRPSAPGAHAWPQSEPL